MPTARTLVRLGAGLGLILVASSSLVAGTTSRPFSASQVLLVLAFGIWSLVPYAVLWLSSWRARDRAAWGGATLAVLAGELGIRLAVFVYPSGSTAAVALVFSPAFLTFPVLPAGWIGGFLVGRLGSVSKGLGAMAGAGFLAACGLFSLSLARPELTPWATWERRQQLAEIGDPRIALGAKSWTRTRLVAEPGWVQVGELDGRPGDEIAHADHHRILLIDPFAPTARNTLTHGSPEGSRWSWYSRLARFGDRHVIVQSGGGYQETEVLELDGRRLWRYRPGDELPPSVLMPCELDGDGQTDLVAIDGTRLVRLDQQGRELWQRTVAYGSSLLLAPPSPAGGSAPIATVDHQGLALWTGAGERVATVPAPDCRPAALVDLDPGHRLLCGSSSLRGYGLDGSRQFELPLEGLQMVQATAFRPDREAGALLAIVSSAPRDVGRWRLTIRAAGVRNAYRERVYEEILDEPPGLLVARGPDGRELLLVKLARSGLWLLRPSPPR